MAKAIIIEKTGGPEVLHLKDVKFRQPIKNEIVVRHTAVGINYLDIEQRSGAYKLISNAHKLKLPAILGAEAVGIVEEVGEGSNCDLKKGDRVCYCTIPHGAYAQKRLMSARYVLKAPQNLSDDLLAASFYKSLLSFYLTTRIYLIRDEITVMVHDVTSDIGDILCQWIRAKSASCKIIGTVNAQEKLKIAENAKTCDLVLDYTKDIDQLYKTVMEFTNGNGVSAVYDCVGRDTYLLSVNCLCMFGLYLLYEQRSGAIPNIWWQHFRSKSLFFTYPSVFHYAKNIVDFAMCAQEVFHFLQNKMIKPKIAKKYSLEQVQQAHKDIENDGLMGSGVIMF